MTNREKINNMTDEEFVEKFNTKGQNCEVCSFWDKDKNFCNSKGFDGRNGDDCYVGFLQWLSQDAIITADEIFERLGYKKVANYGPNINIKMIEYEKKIVNDEVKIIRFFKYHNDDNWSAAIYTENSDLITYANDKEVKAINKKMEELINGE